MLRRYAKWLHGRFPAGRVERLPVVHDDGTTNIPGVRVVGDLTGIPLLKFAIDSGVRAVRRIVEEPDFVSSPKSDDGLIDLAIVGGGVAGIAAAIEAKKQGLSFEVYEGSTVFSTVTNFPQGKPIFTLPAQMVPRGQLQVSAKVKEALVEELQTQRLAAGIEPVKLRVKCIRSKGGALRLVDAAGGPDRIARRVIVAIGRSGNFRRLGVSGEQLGKVVNRLHDPCAYRGEDVMVVGGGDSALETAVALVLGGANVTLSYRGTAFSRANSQNVQRVDKVLASRAHEVDVACPAEARVSTAITSELIGDIEPGTLRVELGSEIGRIEEATVALRLADGNQVTLANDAVFSMIGRDAPLDFFRRSGLDIQGEMPPRKIAACVAFLAFCTALFHWKSYDWFPVEALDPASWLSALPYRDTQPDSLAATLQRSASGPSFYYTLVYSALVGVFGFRRIAYRKTPYVKLQTWTLMLVQWVPLFLLPEIFLPWAGQNEWFVQGAPLRGVADLFWESYDGGLGVERAYWRSYGFVLAWPLMVYNWFTDQPLIGWLVVGFAQTFVLIPWLVWRYGKGAFCGWICPCGALAETLGDRHRHKMPHGPVWNRLNFVGQVLLALAVVLMALRVWGWVFPAGFVDVHFNDWVQGKSPLSYKWAVDVMLAGVLGVGLYFWFSGRVWCRFACPLAALMNIYARFSQFRIFAKKERCISCNVCTSVCHQGIDVMNFANKGVAMDDPQCVRCSACVQSCPTDVLQFGRIESDGSIVVDRLRASSIS